MPCRVECSQEGAEQYGTKLECISSLGGDGEVSIHQAAEIASQRYAVLDDRGALCYIFAQWG